MPFLRIHFLLLILLCLVGPELLSQSFQNDSPLAQKREREKEVKFLSLKPAPTFDKKRFWVMAGTGTGIYAGTSIALWHAWYKDFPLTSFHTFNDMEEWLGMDKAGHLNSAYLETNYSFSGALWTGMDRRKAMWTAAGVGMGIQTTIEIMDGFSEEWGFSFGDIAFNTLGVGLFVGQELLWQEQRIKMKVSGSRPNYPTSPIFSSDGEYQTSLDERAEYLYGISAPEVILKDYNALTVWASCNLRSFLYQNKRGRFPDWINLAFGYGANNLYGGFSNNWTDEDGGQFFLDAAEYPRFRQFYLAPDIDLTRIPTRHQWLKFVLGLANWIKVPAPALELNTKGQVKFHALHW